ncbi:MAG: hypothetical protein KKA81_12565 [Bacteroidetes bacterium]|nr:hypothetical protein [Bacteroidota bacterium]
MKKITLMLAILSISLMGMAQDKEKDEIQTLFGNKNGKMSHGGYGALSFGYTRLDNKDAMLAGIRGGWIIDHHVTIGLAGYGIVNDFEYSDEPYLNGEEYNLAGGYGGLLIEPIIAPHYPVHVTFPVLIGAGGVASYRSNCYCDNDWDGDDDYCYDCWDSRYEDGDAFFIVEPGIELELNLVKFMRVSIGGSYRWTSNVGIEHYDKDLMHGFSGKFSLKFGKF